MKPDLIETRQLCRLRSLRVQRAEARRDEAKAAADAALAAVIARREVIAAQRARLQDLDRSLAEELAATQPRWAVLAKTEREWLTDQLARLEYALLGEERKLEQAQARMREATLELARAREREQVVREMAADAVRERLRTREARAESELEDRSWRAGA